MSQWKINDLEFEVLLDDADFVERYESAFSKLEEKEKCLQKTGKASDIVRGYCKMFYELFDDIFGKGTGDKLFKGRMSASLCEEVYESFIEHCSNEAKRIAARKQKMLNKYKPKRGK